MGCRDTLEVFWEVKDRDSSHITLSFEQSFYVEVFEFNDEQFEAMSLCNKRMIFV